MLSELQIGKKYQILGPEEFIRQHNIAFNTSQTVENYQAARDLGGKIVTVIKKYNGIKFPTIYSHSPNAYYIAEYSNYIIFTHNVLKEIESSPLSNIF